MKKSVLILIVFLISSIANAAHFTFTTVPGVSMVVGVPDNIPMINDVELAIGDEIGVFTGSDLCVGAYVWDGDGVAITIYGDDIYTTETVEGLAANEPFYFKVWNQSEDVELEASVTFTSGTNNFISGTFIAVQSLTSYTAPEITVDPVSSTIFTGNDVTLTVAATSTIAKTYQWQKDGVDITDATDSSYDITSATIDNAGDYRCIVSNASGSDTSIVATITVNSTVEITANPSSVIKWPGESVEFAISVSGTAPVTYQWQKDGVDIADATNSTYTIASISASDAADYTCVATNGGGSVISSAATLTVNSIVVITEDPIAQEKWTGEEVTFSITATGTAPITYQWQKNGSDIEGANDASFTISDISLNDAASYKCIAVNGGGSKTSAEVLLSVNETVSITMNPQNQTVSEGEAVSFYVLVAGTAPITYQWKKNGEDITDATDSNYIITEVVLTDAAEYSCVVTNGGGSVTSASATLIVNSIVAITTDPISQDAWTGEDVTLTIATTGTAPVTYQWQKDGVDINGKENASLTISGIALSDAASYKCIATNIVGSDTSDVAVLTVNETVSIVNSSNDTIISVNDDITLVVTTSGTAPITYQWQKNGVDIFGEQSNSFSILGADTTDSGDYTCIATNGGGSDTCIAIKLTVEYETAIEEEESPVENKIKGIAVAPNIVTTDDLKAHFIISNSICGEGTIVVYDVLGQVIDEQDVAINNGGHFSWNLKNKNGRDVASGSYFVMLKVTDESGNSTVYKTKMGVKRD